MERVSILAFLYWREQYPCRGQAGLRRAYRLTSSGIITQGCIYAVVYSVQRRKSESKNHIISRGTDLRDITTWTTAPTQPVSFRFARVRYRVLCTMRIGSSQLRYLAESLHFYGWMVHSASFHLWEWSSGLAQYCICPIACTLNSVQ